MSKEAAAVLLSAPSTSMNAARGILTFLRNFRSFQLSLRKLTHNIIYIGGYTIYLSSGLILVTSTLKSLSLKDLLFFQLYI